MPIIFCIIVVVNEVVIDMSTGENGRTIVGYNKNATVYRHMHHMKRKKKNIKGMDISLNVKKKM